MLGVSKQGIVESPTFFNFTMRHG